MELAFTGKILWVKKLNVRSDEVFSDFRVVAPDLTFSQGVALLEKEAEHNQSSAPNPRQGKVEGKQQSNAGTKTRQEAEQTVCCNQ